MTNSRRKGRNAENEFAKRYGGTRISEAGLPGPDVQLPQPLYQLFDTDPQPTLWEIKRPHAVAALKWLKQAVEENAHLAFRVDGDTTWYTLHPVTDPCPCPLQETTE